MKTSRLPAHERKTGAFDDDDSDDTVDPLELGRSFLRSATGDTRTYGDDIVDFRAFED